MTDPNPIARLRAALKSLQSLTGLTPPAYIDGIVALAQLETEREEMQRSYSQLQRLHVELGAEADKRIRELESQLSALRAPLNRRHPDEAPINGNPGLLFCFEEDGKWRLLVGYRRNDVEWRSGGCVYHHSEVRWWLHASELLTDEPVPLRSPASDDEPEFSPGMTKCPHCFDGGACLPGGCGIKNCERCGKMCPTCNGSCEVRAPETAPMDGGLAEALSELRECVENETLLDSELDYPPNHKRIRVIFAAAEKWAALRWRPASEAPVGVPVLAWIKSIRTEATRLNSGTWVAVGFQRDIYPEEVRGWLPLDALPEPPTEESDDAEL